MVKRSTPKLDSLFSRAKSLTSRYGERQSLARFLGVVPQVLSAWLSGKNEPGGESTLQLLEWVQAAEVQQKKDREGAVTPPRQMTRKKKSTSNEKPKPSPADS